MPSTHTLTLRILSTRNPLSTGYNFNFDYFDAWDGTPMPRGQAEAPFAKTWNWTEDVSPVASTGRYFRDGTAMWSAFTSDHVIYQALATSWARQVEVSIDGLTREVVSLVNTFTTRACSTGVNTSYGLATAARGDARV